MITKTSYDSKDNWLIARQKYIGSSEVATICGLNRFKTPLQLWAEKTGKIQCDAENDHMWFGTEMEPIVAKYFTRRTGKQVERDGHLYLNDDYPLACATPDYVIPQTDEILEIKTSSVRAEPYWSEDKPPTGAHIQVIWQLGVTGRKSAYVAGLLGADPEKFFTPHVEFDSSIFGQLYDSVSSFMDMVQRDVAPQATGRDIKTLDQIVNRLEATRIQFDDSDSGMIQRYFEFEKELKEQRSKFSTLETELDDLRAKIVQKMGASTVAIGNGYQAKIKTIQRNGYIVAPSSYTRFSVSELKEGK